MPRLNYAGESLQAKSGETVLDCFERHGIPVVSSCRAGVCQSCVLQAEEESIALLPAVATAGLKLTRKRLGYFLSCQCPATEGLSVRQGLRSTEGLVTRTRRLSPRVYSVHLRLREPLEFHAGQFVQLRRSDGLARPYSIASLPSDEELELHVAEVEGGAMSHWLADASGQSVQVTGPQGDCIYLGDPQEPLVLAGTGTGLAPLWGIVRAALRAGHRAPIWLLHGARSSAELYYLAELHKLESSHDNVTLQASVLEGDAQPPTISTQPLAELLLACPLLPQARTYLCGDPHLIRSLKKRLYLAGVDLGRIHADPFVPAAR